MSDDVTLDTKIDIPIVGPSSAVPQEPPLMRLIEAAVRDQSIPLDRLGTLLEWAEKERKEQRTLALNRAITAAQAEVRAVFKDQENTETHSTYASYAKIDEAIRPIIAKYGLGITFNEGDSPKEKHIRIIAKIVHAAGGYDFYHRDVPISTVGPKGTQFMTETHAKMTAEAYARRYLITGIFNVPTKDDDGNAAGRGDTITQEQAQTVLDLIAAAGVEEQVVYDFCKVDNVSQIKPDQFESVRKKLENTIEKKKPKGKK